MMSFKKDCIFFLELMPENKLHIDFKIKDYYCERHHEPQNIKRCEEQYNELNMGEKIFADTKCFLALRGKVIYF